ncbi:MAG: homoserine O-acetyltransferase MetX, partial [Actinomycetaceae bacterium]
VAEALAGVRSRTLSVAISSDRLFLPAEAERIAAGVSGPADYVLIDSPYGHDGFLVESAQVGAALADLLEDKVDSIH